MTIPPFDEAAIRQHATVQSFQRGQEYYWRGAVTSLACHGKTIQAQVSGSERLPYRVKISFSSDGSITATCTCPYDLSGWCKHIVAVLLTNLHEPESSGTMLPPDTLIDPRPVRGEIRAILHSLDHLRRSQAYWHVGEVVDQVRRWLEEVQALIQDQEYHDALLMLEAITDEYVKEWIILDDSDGLPPRLFCGTGKGLG
jgi:hypothetical protein